MATIPHRILSAMENTHRELNELERRLKSAMDDSDEFAATCDVDAKKSHCDKCQELRNKSRANTSPSPPSKSSKAPKKVENDENRCPWCVVLSERLEFMNDEMNRVCESEVRLKENLDTLMCDYEMAQQELGMATIRIDGKTRALNENLDRVENLKSQLLANSADRIASLQFELERKVDELQRLGEEHMYMLSLHYSSSGPRRVATKPGLRRKTDKFGAEFIDMDPRCDDHRESLDKDLEAISELKLQLHENQKMLQERDTKLSEKEMDLQKISEAHATLEAQLKTYMVQFERMQTVVAEYKEREDIKNSRGIQDCDITQLEEDFPSTPELKPTEANCETEDNEGFFEELDELSNRLEESRLNHSMLENSRSELLRMESSRVSELLRTELSTPKKKSVSFAFIDDVENSFEVCKNESLSDSKLVRMAILEQKARAFELRAENLCQELENVRANLREVNEARDDLTELVRVQDERISLFIEENASLKSKLDRSIQDSLDETSPSEDERQRHQFRNKVEQLDEMLEEIEVRNCTLQELAKSMDESRTNGTSQLGSFIHSEFAVGNEGSTVASELQRLTVRLNEINRENELLHVQVDKAKDVIEDLQKRIDAHDYPNTTVEQHTFDKSLADNSQLDYMKHENEMLCEKLEHLQEKLTNSEEEIKEKEKQLVHLRQVMQIRAERIRVVEDDLEKKEVKIASYVAMIKKMKETKKTDEELKLQEERLFEEEKTNWEEERSAIEKEKNKVEDEKKKIEKELNFAKLRYDDLKGQMEDLENDFENLTNQLAQVHESKTSLESDLNKSNERNCELRTRISNLERDLASRNIDNQNAKSVKWALESEIADLKDQVAELELKFTAENGGENLAEENKYLKECVEEQMDRLAEGDADRLKLQNDLDAAQSQLLTLEKDILLKDDRIEQLQAKADEIEELRAQVQHSDDKRHLLEKVVHEKEKYVVDIGSQLQAFTEKNETLEEELSTAFKNVEVLQAALDNREKELELIHEEIMIEKAEKASLVEQVRNMKEKLQEAQAKPTFANCKAVPMKELLLIDLTSPTAKSETASPRTYRIAKRTMTPAKRALDLDCMAQKLNENSIVDLSSSTSQHQLSTSTLCFDLMEKSVLEIGPLEPTPYNNDTMMLNRHCNAPSQASFISGVNTVSTPSTKRTDAGSEMELQLLRDNVESKAATLMKQIQSLETECEELKDRCRRLEESNKIYQYSMQNSKESQKVLEEKVLSLIHANHDLQEKLKEKVELCEALSKERDRLIQEFGNADSLMRNLVVVEAEKRELCVLIEKLRSELNRVASNNCKLNQKINEMDERIENVDCIESELDDYKQALEQVEAEKLSLQVEMDEKIECLSREVIQVKVKFMQANAKLSQYQNMDDEFQKLNLKYGAVIRENEAKNEEIKELEMNLQKLQDVEKDFAELHNKNSQICKELSELERMIEDQEALKEVNNDLNSKCKELCQELDDMKFKGEKADYLAVELDKIRDHYEGLLLEAKSQNDSSLEKSFSKLDLIDLNSKARLEQLHEDVRRAMEAKFQLELDLQQALHCAKKSDSKNQLIANQLARIVTERNDIVSRLNEVTRKLNDKEDVEPYRDDNNPSNNTEVLVIDQ